MTAFRLLVIALVLMLAGAAMVMLRAEQVRLAFQTAALERRAVQVQRRVWEQQLEMARLRAPALVRERRAGGGLIARAPGRGKP